ncbi:DUF2795 domain-containing protein [Nocardia asteroides]|uniref:DUF2795 domain-containing protein n=1 Tax=Nocardia asteroides TaxID=1824 RepID=UPI001E29D1C5|nr:DUF2795 domain-containing protein [Nocardia asteroides]UGT61459.1 DUF2795 domain-containing protein [Nocardia asteroides]
MAQVNPIQVQKFLSGVDYPADRDDLLAAARSNSASDDVLDALGDLPERTFDGPNAVSQELS